MWALGRLEYRLGHNIHIISMFLSQESSQSMILPTYPVIAQILLLPMVRLKIIRSVYGHHLGSTHEQLLNPSIVLSAQPHCSWQLQVR
jgi:hypothetical protein